MKNFITKQRGFILYAVLVAVVLIMIIYAYMYENLRLAYLVAQHAAQQSALFKQCHDAVDKLLSMPDFMPCKDCFTTVNKQQFNYQLEYVNLVDLDADIGIDIDIDALADDVDHNLALNNTLNQNSAQNSAQNPAQDPVAEISNYYIQLKLACRSHQQDNGIITVIYDPVVRQKLSWRVIGN